jgi:hypothetical protein
MRCHTSILKCGGALAIVLFAGTIALIGPFVHALGFVLSGLTAVLG